MNSQTKAPRSGTKQQHQSKNADFISETGLKTQFAGSYPQSGAGHHRQSGSEARHLLSRNSSYFSIRAASSKMSATCRGASLSAHSGQLSWTRLSVISMRRYWRRQQRQDRWLQPSSSGSWSAGWRTRHRGHSRRLVSPEEAPPPRDGWLEESGFEGVPEAASWGVVAVVAVVVVVGLAAAAAAAELKAEGCSCCCVWWWWDKGVAAPPLGALVPRELRLPWKRLWKEMRPWRLPGARHLGLGTPLTEEWGDSESFSDPIFPRRDRQGRLLSPCTEGLWTTQTHTLSDTQGRICPLVKPNWNANATPVWGWETWETVSLLFFVWLETKPYQQNRDWDNR